MNGTLGAIFLCAAIFNPTISIMSSIDRVNVLPYDTIGFAETEFQKDHIGSELNFVRANNFAYGPLQRAHAISLTDKNGFWIGSGFTNTIPISDAFLSRFSFLPGIYFQGDEVDLGGWLMFRSGIEFEMSINEFFSLGLSYDHRSSGDLWAYNPGMETWQLRLTRYFKKK